MEGLDGGRLYTCVQMLPFPEGTLFCFISSRARKWAVNQSVVDVDGQLTSTGGDDGEEIERERKYDGFARKIQKAWRRQFFFQLKQKGLKLIFLLVYLWAHESSITGVFFFWSNRCRLCHCRKERENRLLSDCHQVRQEVQSKFTSTFV